MIQPTLNSLRSYLHVLAVSVWLGGQIVLAGVVPKLAKRIQMLYQTLQRAMRPLHGQR